MKKLFIISLLGLTSLFSYPVMAHHSGALFYDASNDGISLTGKVTKFSFRNPHAIVELSVTSDDGQQLRWTAETSAPSALRRRGWSQASLDVGEVVTLDGFQARDGSFLMRITKVTKADGSVVGVSGNLDD